jgi:hypothetical protein
LAQFHPRLEFLLFDEPEGAEIPVDLGVLGGFEFLAQPIFEEEDPFFDRDGHQLGQFGAGGLTLIEIPGRQLDKEFLGPPDLFRRKARGILAE